MKITKDLQINKVEEIIRNKNFRLVEKDLQKPWGAYFRLDNKDAVSFIDEYFRDIKSQFKTFEGLSPKYLLVQPGERLSWQYHYRRAEHWRVLNGTVGVMLSDDDNEPVVIETISEGGLVQFPALKRHRLIGLDDWGVVVEIWQHTELNNPSDEQDIVRVADDYRR